MTTIYQRHQHNLSRIRNGSQLDDLVRHFRPGNNHSIEDYQVFGVENISKDDGYRKTREIFWIGKLGTLKPRGLNTKSCWISSWPLFHVSFGMLYSRAHWCFHDILRLIWRLVCWSCVVDYLYGVQLLFDARHGVKKRCQTWHRVVLTLTNPMPCLASFLDAMSGVKNHV